MREDLADPSPYLPPAVPAQAHLAQLAGGSVPTGVRPTLRLAVM